MMSCDKNKKIIPWKLIPLDLENSVILKPNSSDVRPIPLTSAQPLKDPRLFLWKTPSKPKTYFRWPDHTPSSYQQKVKETKPSESFESTSTSHSWHKPVGQPYSFNCGQSDADSMLREIYDLEEGEIPPWEC